LHDTDWFWLRLRALFRGVAFGIAWWPVIVSFVASRPKSRKFIRKFSEEKREEKFSVCRLMGVQEVGGGF